MREIKFRGKDNGHWVYGDYIHGGCFNPETEEVTVRHIISSDFLHDVDPNTIGQYTKLHDKNGKEIYEGDIVTIMRTPEKRQRRELVRHVVTCHNVCDWVFESLAHEVCGLMMANHSDFDSYKFEIIGNIFDNPELAQPYSLNLPENKHRQRKRTGDAEVELVMDGVKVSTKVSQGTVAKLIEKMQK
jgi:uncharacterized phage protein (TIGR01671 family)